MRDNRYKKLLTKCPQYKIIEWMQIQILYNGLNVVISWFLCQGLDLVIFLEVEGHFCPLDCVMAIERIG